MVVIGKDETVIPLITASLLTETAQAEECDVTFEVCQQPNTDSTVQAKPAGAKLTPQTGESTNQIVSWFVSLWTPNVKEIIPTEKTAPNSAENQTTHAPQDTAVQSAQEMIDPKDFHPIQPILSPR